MEGPVLVFKPCMLCDRKYLGNFGLKETLFDAFSLSTTIKRCREQGSSKSLKVNTCECASSGQRI